MKRADIQGDIFSQSEHPCGRLVKVDYDSARKVMGFLVPSTSPKRQDRVYSLELDCMTGQIACGCEAFRDFRNGYKMPYRREIAGTFLEQLHRSLYPLITRPPKHCCPHAKRVRSWLMRHKTPDGKTLYDHISAIVSAWEQDEVKKTA